MKKLMTLILATLGICGNSYANCFETVETKSHDANQNYEEARSHCFVTDLRTLNDIRMVFDEASIEEKYQLINQYDGIFQRLKDQGYGDILAASAYCMACSGGH